MDSESGEKSVKVVWKGLLEVFIEFLLKILKFLVLGS